MPFVFDFAYETQTNFSVLFCALWIPYPISSCERKRLINIKRDYLSFDFIMIILVCALAVFGIIVIGSATHITANGPSREYTYQQIWFATGLILMLLSAFIDYHFIARFYIPLYLLNISLLVLVLILGRNEEGVSRWIRIGGATIQPSEFAKIFMIIYLAKFIDKKNESVNNVLVLLFLLFTCAVPTILIMIQPSLSASLVLPVLTIAILFVGGLSYKYFIGAAVVFGPLLGLLYFDLSRDNPWLLQHIYKIPFMRSYWIEDRIIPLLNPDPTSTTLEQTQQSISAIGSGQLYGKGLYNGTINQLSYLPANHNDFIFSVIGEELGFAGCVAVLCIMFIIILKCTIIAQKATDTLGRLIASGVAVLLAFQTFVNVGVATGIMPNTGIPFPFVSSGGSAMWITMIAVGLAINVGMTKPKSIFEG